MSRFVKDSTYNLAAQCIALIIGLASGIILARWLGPQLRGHFALVMLLPQSLMALISSGFAAAIIYFIASGAWPASHIFSIVLGMAIWLSGVMAIAGLALLFLGGRLFPGASMSLLALSLIFIPVLVLQQSFGCVLQGQRAFRLQLVVMTANAAIQFAAVFVVLVVLKGKVVAALVASFGSQSLGVIITVICARRVVGADAGPWRPRLSLSQLRPVFSYGARAHAANALAFLNYRVDQFLVNAMAGNTALGLYSVAVGWAEKLWLVVGNVGGVLFPKVASGELSEKRMAEETSRLARIMLLTLVVTGLGLAALIIPLVRFLYGQEYVPSAFVVLALVPGVVFLGYAKIFSNYLAGRGKPEINAQSAFWGLLINLACNLWLIPRFGIIGAALATSISYIFIALWCYIGFIHLSRVNWLSPILMQAPDFVILRGLIQRAAAKLRERR